MRGRREVRRGRTRRRASWMPGIMPLRPQKYMTAPFSRRSKISSAYSSTCVRKCRVERRVDVSRRAPRRRRVPRRKSNRSDARTPRDGPCLGCTSCRPSCSSPRARARSRRLCGNQPVCRVHAIEQASRRWREGRRDNFHTASNADVARLLQSFPDEIVRQEVVLAERLPRP